MIWMNPEKVTLNGILLGGVQAVAVSRGAGHSVVEYGDEGPHVVFADVPEQRVDIRLERTLEDGAAVGAGVGDTVRIEFETSRGTSDVLRKRVSIDGVVLSSDVSIKGDTGGRVRLQIVGVSVDGAQDPVSVTEL